MTDAKNRRSLMVYSALTADDLPDVMSSGADLVCFDLEDGTALPRKDEARLAIMQAFARRNQGGASALLRINSPRINHGLRDLLAVLDSASPPDGLVLPKVSHPLEVRWGGELLETHHPQMELIPLIEDQAGLDHANAIAAAHPMVSALFLGSVDLSGELRSDMSWDALFDARATLVRAASAAGIDCIDGPWLDVDDAAGLTEEVARVAAMGFTGKASYSPRQIATLHSAFTPNAEQLALALRVVAAVDSSATGGAVVDGRSVNKANAKGARRLLKLARRRGVYP